MQTRHFAFPALTLSISPMSPRNDAISSSRTAGISALRAISTSRCGSAARVYSIAQVFTKGETPADAPCDSLGLDSIWRFRAAALAGSAHPLGLELFRPLGAILALGSGSAGLRLV